MATAIAITYHALPPRRALSASATTPAWRVPPRVYTPFPARVLRRPMAEPHGNRTGEEHAAAAGRRRGLFAQGRDR